MARVPPLPNFLIIGAHRCATRWLRFNLDKHPDIYMPPFEIRYFDDVANVKTIRLGGYRRRFEGWDGEPFMGESSPSYMTYGLDVKGAAERIKLYLPDVRIIAMVRQPIERLESAFLHYVKAGRLPPNADLVTMFQEHDPLIEELSLLNAGVYGHSLDIYNRLFGDDLLVLFHEDIVEDPAGVYLDALAHIGVEDPIVPRDIGRVLYSARKTVRLTKPILPDELRDKSYWWFRQDAKIVEEITGRDLSHWDPELSSSS